MNNEIASQVQLSVKGFSRVIKFLVALIMVIAFLIFVMKSIF